MPGEMDVYQLCPCGSGKKLKFCCHAIVSEMAKVAELQKSHQHQAALTLLEAVEKKTQPRDVWSRAWVKTTEAFLLFGLGKGETARQLVDEVLDELPEHPLAVGVKAVLSASSDGYPACMRAAYRAFVYSANSQPYLVSYLAMLLANLMLSKMHLFGARQNLALAVSFDPENEDAGKQFVEFISDEHVPYPLRDGYALAPMGADEALKPQFDQGSRLAQQGRYSDAAKAFGMAARQAPKRSGLWWNIAICHAAAAEDPLAVEALKAAAANEPDFESAVDCLVLARQLRVPTGSGKVEQMSAKYVVESVSKLLTALDQRPEYVRVERPEDPDVDADLPATAAVYRILDRDPSLVANADLSVENVTHVVGDLAIFDRAEGAPARVFVSGLGPTRLAQVTVGFLAVAGALVQPEGELRVHGYFPTEKVPLIQDWYFPDDLSLAQLNELRKSLQRRLIDEVWPNTAQEALGGKSPVEAAQSAELNADLAAAVVDFDVFCESNGLSLDQAALRSRLGLPPVVATQPADGAIGPSLSLLGLRHLALPQLSDQELALAVDHVMQLGHSRLGSAVFAEALDRPALQEKLDVPRFCMYLSRTFSIRREFEAALHWIVRGKEACKARKQPLSEMAMWELNEVMVRAQRPDDPQVIQIANTLWNYYVPKLPAVREMIVGILNELSIPGPWNGTPQRMGATEPLAGAGVGVGASGVWTPEAETAGQPSKPWLPGQE